MHEENRTLLELELDDETLDALLEIVNPLTVHARGSEKGVALLPENRQPVIKRTGAIFALVNGVMAKRARNDVGLVHIASSDRARVDLDQAYDVGILRLDEVRDPLQVRPIADEISHPRQRPMQGGAQAKAVANVVKQQPHLLVRSEEHTSELQSQSNLV